MAGVSLGDHVVDVVYMLFDENQVCEIIRKKLIMITIFWEVERNKAVYTTASVVYGLAGAVTQVKVPLGVYSYCVTDGQTNQPTDSDF